MADNNLTSQATLAVDHFLNKDKHNHHSNRRIINEHILIRNPSHLVNLLMGTRNSSPHHYRSQSWLLEDALTVITQTKSLKSLTPNKEHLRQKHTLTVLLKKPHNMWNTISQFMSIHLSPPECTMEIRCRSLVQEVIYIQETVRKESQLCAAVPFVASSGSPVSHSSWH